jgi:hypothetical protein
MQFQEQASKKGKCPVCGKEVVIRSTRGAVAFCSRVCSSQRTFGSRYSGTMSGPLDRPRPVSKTKFQ